MGDPLLIDDVTGRPLWKGLPVPWIAWWSGEGNTPPYDDMAWAVDDTGQQHMAYSTTEVYNHPLGWRPAFNAQRDDLGLLWFKLMPDRQDTGTPGFAALHAERQRDCMIGRRCQVCGQHFGPAPTTFLVAAEAMRVPGSAFYTMTAPTCTTCIPVAMRTCPEQRKVPRSIVTAHRYEPTYVLCDIYTPTGKQSTERLALDDPKLSRALVKQIGIRIHEYDERPVT